MIFNNHTPEEYEFPILISSFFRADNNLNNLIIQPRPIESIEGISGYVFLLNGLQVTFYLTITSKIPNHLIKYALRRSGQMTIIHLPKGFEETFLKNMIKPNGDFFI